uniref:Flocculation protein FLO11 n=1 Tax=Noccaea caerulescens TaxID=107243 RepID=A0A1J3CL00_NOCCA
MADSRKRDAGDDHHDQPNDGEDVSDSSTIDSRSNAADAGSEREDGGTRIENRVSDPLTDEGGRDFLLGEDRVLRWLQALDMQVLGACRGDERLKPLLKLNVSNGMAEDRLLAHLSQHFEPAEIGMLARCFCIPLVSVRVGKIKKEGALMRPTTIRGNLSLMVLPTADLRLSFIGDDGHSEQLFTYTRKSQCSAVSIEEITADSSGRSFVIRIADGNAFYYWCSEKSKLLGTELRRKMKDLIKKKPSISELTGIEESRLGSVASHLRLYLMGSVMPNVKGCPAPTPDSLSSETADSSSSSASSKSLRARHSGTQLTKAQGSLSPRSSSFKENTLKNSSLRISSRDKSKRRSEGHFSIFDNLPITSIPTNVEGFIQSEEGEEAAEDNNGVSQIIASEAAELAPSIMTLPPHFPLKMGPPVFSPYYCWCPPSTSSLHAPSASYQFPPLSIELPSLPPLSSLLPASGSDGFLISSSPLDLSDIPPLPLVHRIPIPGSSSSSSSQQMMMPIMCDPIVHIPVIDICSSGQGYLVSAGPTGMIPTSITPLPVENDSLVEKGARETLRLLISGANASTSAPLNLHGSRGLYSGSRGMGGASLFAPIGLQQPSQGDGGDVGGGESVSSGEAVHVPPRESSG